MLNTEPTALNISSAQQTVTIAWADGHISTYPWWYLRGLCPCASCQGHRGPNRFIPNDSPELGDVDEVGHYAVRLIWDKTHATGIYAFDYLRSLCPYKNCRSAAGATHQIHILPATRQAELEQLF